jgi:hypothetical protein
MSPASTSTPHLTTAASRRLATLGLHPTVVAADAAGLPASRADDRCYDWIVATVAMPGVPAGWLAALRPGGRLVTTIAGTCMTITADRTPDGGATGQVEMTQAGFMPARPGAGDYPLRLLDAPDNADLPTREGEVTASPYPVMDVAAAWEVWMMLEVTTPGIQHHYRRDEAAWTEMALMVHPDGSWARATGQVASRRWCTRAAPAGCGTIWTRSGIAGWSAAGCRSTAPMCASTRTGPATCNAAGGGRPSRRRRQRLRAP